MNHSSYILNTTPPSPHLHNKWATLRDHHGMPSKKETVLSEILSIGKVRSRHVAVEDSLKWWPKVGTLNKHITQLCFQMKQISVELNDLSVSAFSREVMWRETMLVGQPVSGVWPVSSRNPNAFKLATTHWIFHQSRHFEYRLACYIFFQ